MKLLQVTNFGSHEVLYSKLEISCYLETSVGCLRLLVQQVSVISFAASFCITQICLGLFRFSFFFRMLHSSKFDFSVDYHLQFHHLQIYLCSSFRCLLLSLLFLIHTIFLHFQFQQLQLDGKQGGGISIKWPGVGGSFLVCSHSRNQCSASVCMTVLKDLFEGPNITYHPLLVVVM